MRIPDCRPKHSLSVFVMTAVLCGVTSHSGCATKPAPVVAQPAAANAAWCESVPYLTAQQQRLLALGEAPTFVFKMPENPSREDAFFMLQNGDVFTLGSLGDSDQISPQVRAFYRLLHEPDAADAFARLQSRAAVGSSRVDLQACKLEYSIVSPK